MVRTSHQEPETALIQASLNHAEYAQALTNAVRHAGTTSVAVRVRHDIDRIAVVVENDGSPVPAAPAGSPDSSGLRGLARRVGALGGHFAADPGDHRFVVTAVIPYQTGAKPCPHCPQ